MRIGVLNETFFADRRAVLVPNDVKKLISAGYEVVVEYNIGKCASFTNNQYIEAGAKISSRENILNSAEILLFVHLPDENFLKQLKNKHIIVAGYGNHSTQITCDNLQILLLSRLPRLSNLQHMDINSSQDMLGGYAAACRILSELKQTVPLTITAAGSLPPATFLVIGIGVFGLSVISTLKKIGGNIYAYDINPQSLETAKSVGAKIVDLSTPEKMHHFLPSVDALVCSAFSFGKKAPQIINSATFKFLKQGSVVIDAAKSSGGNIWCSEANKVILKNTIKVFGYENWASLVPNSASILLSSNFTEFIMSSFTNGKPDTSKEYIKEMFLS